MIYNKYMRSIFNLVGDFMNDIKFKSLEELYKRLLPALKSKRRELYKKGLVYVYEEDIWNYLKNKRWTSSMDLDLGSMVNDIFNVQEREIKEYIEVEFKNTRRKVK